jgi:hypothetical protein
MMRWDLTKRAWAMAKAQFPSVQRLYVDIPDRLEPFGECRVVDLEKPHETIATISYDMRPGRVKLALNNATAEVDSPKLACGSAVAVTVKKAEADIDPVLLSKRYPDKAELAKQVAILMIGHRSGFRQASKLTPGQVSGWLSDKGFDAALFQPVCDELRALGVGLSGFNLRVARDPRPNSKYKIFERVRVRDAASMEYQECGQILDVRGTKNDGYFYTVLVDGSESPLEFAEENLSELMVGRIPE